MPPEFNSALWNATCALRPATLRNDSDVAAAYFGFTWFLLIFTMVYVVGSVAFFMSFQQRWVYLKKRSLFAIICAAAGAIAQVCLGPLRDILGRAEYPCEAALWLRIFAMVGLAFPFFVKLVFFRDQLMFAQVFSQISFSRLYDVMNESTERRETVNAIFFGRKSLHIADSSNLARISDSDAEKASSMSGVGPSATASLNEEDIRRAVYRQSMRYKVLVLAVPCLPLIIVGFILEFTLPYYYAGDCLGCDDSVLMIAVVVGTCTFIVTAIVYVAYKLRNTADPLNILYDLKVMCVGASIIGTPGLIGLLFDQQFGNIYDRGVFSWDWLIQLAVIWYFTFLCPAPVFVAIQLSKKARSSRYDFHLLLANVAFQKVFMQHLVNEWAMENLRFYQQVTSFKEHYDSFKNNKERNLIAIQTFHTFIKPASVLEVNISANQRSKLIDFFKHMVPENPENSPLFHVPKDIFDESQEEIFMLLEKDSFMRFQQTAQFKEFAAQNLVVDPATNIMVVAAHN